MNSQVWTYPGSRWWKFDFHTHTPASKDTYWAKDGIKLSPEDWLLKYMKAKIDCVAVTDHNSGEWIDKLKNAYAQMKEQADAGSPPEGFRELIIFPGVEISVHGGIHVLAIFDPDTATSDIDTLLGKVNYKGTKGDSDGVTTKGIAEVLKDILESGAIPIPAHADADKGLLAVRADSQQSNIDANTIRQALDVEGVLAVEWVDLNKAYPRCVIDRAKKLTRILGSDCHTFQGNAIPGSRYTWVKMAKPTLEGLKFALLDGNDVSIRRSDEGLFDPYKTPAHFITAIEIEKARYMGNGKHPLRLELTPFYNSLIGGRGTGKSTFVHALRLAYKRADDLKSMEGTEPLRHFNSFCKVKKARNDEGALREQTKIRVELMREGQPTRLLWQNPESPQITVEEKDTDGTWHKSESQEVNSERFPIRLFSQGQIAAMTGGSRQALLSVIDEAANVGKLKEAFEDAKRTYLTQRSRLRELEGKLENRPEVKRKYNEVDRKLSALPQTDHNKVLEAYKRAQDQRKEVEKLFEQLDGLPGLIEETAQRLILEEWPSGVFDEADDAEVLKWRKEADKALQQVRQVLEQGSSDLAKRAEQLQKDPRLSAWRDRTDKAQNDFNDLQQALGAEGEDVLQSYKQLVKERQYLKEQLKSLDEVDKECKKLKEEIAEQWQKVLEAREAITLKRAEFVRNTLKDNLYVRIEVVPFGFDPQVIERSLRELLDVTDDRFGNDILELDEAGNPKAGLAFEIASADDRKAALESSKQQLQEIAGKFGGHFRNYLKKKLELPGFADQIQCWFPEDDLRIEYSRKADGTGWVAITQGSQGQRSAALLAFLLAFGDEPLILDQPEDDLDNSLIYDLIVRQIRANKLRRQLIVVTHNPNVVVNGDAELVDVMDFGKGQCYVRKSGTLQEKDVREEVCRVMEGGRDAFERRWKRLGKG